jgi:hypothetical protein
MNRARLILLVAVLGPPEMGMCAAQTGFPTTGNTQLNESGHTTVGGRSVAYLIRHLPVSSFPQLPDAVQAELNRRGCLIPQTYAAHHPENVIHGSFERPGSSDWTVLCSAGGTVSMLVFFSGAPDKPSVLASSPETQRLQAYDLTGILGFNWAVDAATPEQIRVAQIGMEPRPARLDHDAVGDTMVEQKTVYHFYAKGDWKIVDTGV